MSETPDNSHLPKPNIPKPNIPKPDIPKPTIPKPDLSTPPPNPNPPSFTGSGQPSSDANSISDFEEVEMAEVEEGDAAAMFNRFAAGLIDGVVATVLYFAATSILPDFLDQFAWILSSGYWVVRDSLPFLKAQSVGKMVMKLKAVKEDGSSLENDWITALLRNVLLVIPVPLLAIVELIILYTREGKPEAGRRLGDDWAKTKVIPA